MEGSCTTREGAPWLTAHRAVIIHSGQCTRKPL